MSCHDICSIPVTYKCPRGTQRGNRDCSGGIWCLDCVRSNARLNRPFADRKDVTCPLCHSLVASKYTTRADTVYTVLDMVFSAVDQYTENLGKEKMEEEEWTDPAICRKEGCGKSCGTQRALWKHRHVECPMVMMPCKKCHPQKWMTRAELAEHDKKFHSVVPCPCCSQLFTPGDLVKHQKAVLTAELDKLGRMEIALTEQKERIVLLDKMFKTDVS